MALSTFTLSSTTGLSSTDSASASSTLFDRKNNPAGDDRSTNTFAIQLKRFITDLEIKVKQEDSDETEDTGYVLLKAKDGQDDEVERDKECECGSARSRTTKSKLRFILPSKYPSPHNIILCLWTFAFDKLLESLCRASFTFALTLEHLQDFIYYAYTFYTRLLEDPFKSGWLEALGDLAQ
ncbi:hypothetical protein B0H19DRAFT_1060009 [Mycena capillaripes]|nr:hypothetical protein B0H19DRAFT_1060009 [Mycena capillaripes]